MGDGTPEPTTPLPRGAWGLFLVRGLISAVPIAVGCWVGANVASSEGASDALVLALRLAAFAVVVGGAALSLMRWRSWRYELRDEELDLLRGAVVVTRTLIPTARVQHVDTRRTWTSDWFGLCSVIVHTAGGAHEIPALRAEDAGAMRDRLARLARDPDES